ncbi:hypothetical protein CBL_02914 [Carabus blaptoides fortunei]
MSSSSSDNERCKPISWLPKSKKGDQFAFCKYCDKAINIKCGKDALVKHSSRNIHKENCKSLANQTSITTFIKASTSTNILEQEIKGAEIRLSPFIAEHNLPFNCIEHIPSLVAKICPDSKIAKRLACSRTKTGMIVQNILGAQSFQLVCADFRKKKFFLIVDESTDRSTIKHLCLGVRYCNDSYNTQDNFLTLVPLSEADAVTVYNHIVQFFNENEIPYKANLIAFASDGANVMMGANHSLMALLKNDIPSLFVMKCICQRWGSSLPL